MTPIAWQRPSAVQAAALLRPEEPTASCTVLRVPAAGLDRAWQRTHGTERLPDATTTAASISFGRIVAQMYRTNTGQMPLVRYATHPPAGDGVQEDGEIVFADGRDSFAAATALGASEVEIVVPTVEAGRFLADVGGNSLGVLE